MTFAGETYTASKEITDVPTLDHAYEDGKCTICDAKDPDYKPEISSPDTSDENGFMLWCVLFLAFGSMLSAVMYSRKRRN